MFVDGSSSTAATVGVQERQRYESAADYRLSRLGLSSVERDVESVGRVGSLQCWMREAAGVERYVHKANSRFIGFLVGEVLKAAGGKADPKEAAARVRAALQQRVDASNTPHQQ